MANANPKRIAGHAKRYAAANAATSSNLRDLVHHERSPDRFNGKEGENVPPSPKGPPTGLSTRLLPSALIANADQDIGKSRNLQALRSCHRLVSAARSASQSLEMKAGEP
ncbi:hypothetical protein, partial [Mesorhizobium sp.]|uniref:hypothetical protein n=1 Tax=Mesorhizobium sp. TaxID=1871066 RepID=UPI002580143E